MKIHKTFIFGLAGSGKTSFAKELAKKLRIKDYDLDNIFFEDKNYKKRNEKARQKLLNKIIRNKKWIIEGAHTDAWVSPILKKADLIIILKTNLLLCKIRVLKRYFKRKLNKNVKKETLIGVLSLVKRFVNKRTLNESLNEIKKNKGNNNPKIIIISNKNQMSKFLEEIK